MKRTGNKKNKRNKPLTLYPLKRDEALKNLLQTQPSKEKGSATDSNKK